MKPLPVGSVSQYDLRNNKTDVLPNCRLRITKSSFFPSTTRNWDNLNPKINNSGNANTFTLLNKNTNITFISCDRKLNTIHSRIRTMRSSLNLDLHLVNLKPSHAYTCGHGLKTCVHCTMKIEQFCLTH